MNDIALDQETDVHGHSHCFDDSFHMHRELDLEYPRVSINQFCCDENQVPSKPGRTEYGVWTSTGVAKICENARMVSHEDCLDHVIHAGEENPGAEGKAGAFCARSRSHKDKHQQMI